MNICKQTVIAATLVTSAMLTGCGSSPPSAMTGYPASQATYGRYGVIESIQVVQVSNEHKGPGAGAVVGGIVGGILGNQVGGGLGNAAATAAGVVGGAIVGNNIEKNNRNQQLREAYQISVRLENGTYQSIIQDNIVDLRVGAHVYVKDNHVFRN